MSAASDASELAGLAARAGAQRAGLPAEVVELVGAAITDICKLIFTHHDPAALARDLVAEAAHRTSTRAAIQAAIDLGARRE